MKLIPEDILQELKSKGFEGDCFCDAIDWFRKTKNLFIQYYWMIDEPTNRVVFYFKIDYMWGHEPYRDTVIEKWYDEYDDCQIESIINAIFLI